MVGGENFASHPFNLATQGQRQPGSAFKPFVLATAHPARHLAELGLGVEEADGDRARDERQGEVRRQQLRGLLPRAPRASRPRPTLSDNSVYVQVGMKAGLRRVARNAEELGIRTPVSRNPAMTLGGLNTGVTALDMAHAYSSLAEGGLRVTGDARDGEGRPGRHPKVALRDDKSDVLDTNRRERTRVIPTAVAAETTRVLQSVLTNGTAKDANLGADVPQWGKTGTTENYGDAWFVGSSGSHDRRRLGRLPRPPQADGDRVARLAGVGRHVPGVDLAAVHAQHARALPAEAREAVHGGGRQEDREVPRGGPRRRPHDDDARARAGHGDDPGRHHDAGHRHRGPGDAGRRWRLADDVDAHADAHPHAGDAGTARAGDADPGAADAADAGFRGRRGAAPPAAPRPARADAYTTSRRRSSSAASPANAATDATSRPTAWAVPPSGPL